MPPLPEDARTLEGYLVNMYVKPEHRLRGIGKALLDECLADARASGLRRLNLHATDAARPLYHQVGFTSNDRWMELRL